MVLHLGIVNIILLACGPTFFFKAADIENMNRWLWPVLSAGLVVVFGMMLNWEFLLLVGLQLILFGVMTARIMMIKRQEKADVIR